jgi:hypothetical protein
MKIQFYAILAFTEFESTNPLLLGAGEMEKAAALTPLHASVPSVTLDRAHFNQH